MTRSATLRGFLGHCARTTLHLGVVYALVVIVVMSPTRPSVAFSLVERGAIATLTTSQAKAAHASAEAGHRTPASFAAWLSASAIGIKSTDFCSQDAMHGPGHSCAYASCQTCLAGITVDNGAFSHPVIARDDVVGPHLSTAACDLIPDLPPPRVS